MDLHQLIDDTIEEPPPLRLDRHVAAGRRAARRRRAGLTVCIAATAVIAAGLIGTLRPDDNLRTSPTGTTTSSSAADPESTDGPAQTGAPATAAGYSTDGTLTIDPGWKVTAQITNPVTTPLLVNGPGTEAVPTRSVGLAITDGTRGQWVYSWFADSQGGVAYARQQPDDVGPATLQAFIDIQVALQTGTATDAVAALAADGTITGHNGVEVSEQRVTPSLDRGEASTSVAKVTLPGAPRYPGWILAVRSRDGVRTYPIDGYPVTDSETDEGPDTIDGFIDWVAPKIADGQYR